MILVSACLIGLDCKYKGGNNLTPKILELMKTEDLVPVCAEQLGGFSTPRPPAEIRIVDGKRKVFNINGEDVTEGFERGAKNILDLCLKLGMKKAILKSGSPSCGYGKVGDGTFTGTKIEGNGILTQMLLDNGIEVISSDDFVE